MNQNSSRRGRRNTLLQSTIWETSPCYAGRRCKKWVGGDLGLHGNCDHDLKLRITEQVPARKIIHLAKVLVHVSRAHKRASSNAADANLLQDVITRRRCRALVTATTAGRPRLRYLAKEPPGLVSLIIPTRDRADLLELCVHSILRRTSYRPFEIIVIDNGSEESATFRLFESLRQDPRVRILRSPGEFNFSALNNLAARDARGNLLGLINNDVEVIKGDWLDEMVGLAEHPQVGCVGAKLLYPDGRIQHAGVTMGLGGIAGHGHHLLPRDAPGYSNQMYFTHEVSAVTAACLVVRKCRICRSWRIRRERTQSRLQ